MRVVLDPVFPYFIVITLMTEFKLQLYTYRRNLYFIVTSETQEITKPIDRR